MYLTEEITHTTPLIEEFMCNQINFIIIMFYISFTTKTAWGSHTLVKQPPLFSSTVYSLCILKLQLKRYNHGSFTVIYIGIADLLQILMRVQRQLCMIVRSRAARSCTSQATTPGTLLTMASPWQVPLDNFWNISARMTSYVSHNRYCRPNNTHLSVPSECQCSVEIH